jgi:hypothetical protein
MDYLHEIIAMRSRAGRASVAWQPHLEATKRFVLDSATACEKRDRAVVLGAGLLLDLPLDELASLFREVVLVDIVVLPEIRKQAGRSSNVTMLQRDVTNVAEELYTASLRGLRDLPPSKPSLPEVIADTDLVVSLNILSQLWVMPRTFVLRKTSVPMSEERLDDWCGQIVQAHYEYLRSLTCDVCLVADHRFEKRDRSGALVSQGSTVYNLELPDPDESWTWHIAPIQEESRFLSKDLIVGAWRFPHKN